MNLAAGFIARSAAPADADARCRLDLLRKYAADVRSRCEASGLDAKSLEILDRAMHQARGSRLGDRRENSPRSLEIPAIIRRDRSRSAREFAEIARDSRGGHV